MLVRDHARWILMVMVAGLLPLALGAFLLVREAGVDAKRAQDDRLRTAAASELTALNQSFARARALLEVTAVSQSGASSRPGPGLREPTPPCCNGPMRR